MLGSGNEQLKELFTAVEILEQEFAEFADQQAGRQFAVRNFRTGSAGKQDLSAVGSAADASCPMHFESGVSFGGRNGLTRVNADPDPEPFPRRPVLILEGSLCPGRRD